MILPSNPGKGPSFFAIEVGVTFVVVAIAFCWPRLGSKWLSRAESGFVRLARRRILAVAVVGASAFLLRLAILPLSAIPQPFVQDDFSFLLAGDTFASGRLANPTPAMWMHFESMQITMKPTYMSMYFPAQGLILAAGKVLTGYPWAGLLGTTSLMCAAICWMLQAWLPLPWALFGGSLAVLRLGLFSYWINTYSGGGSIAALGGALVLGAFPRFMREARHRDSLLLSLGVIFLALSRPYEGILLCLPVVAVLGRWVLRSTNRPSNSALVRRVAGPAALIVVAGLWMGYYNYRAFGDPLTPPYKVDREAYAVVPYWIWQSNRAEPVYRHKVMRDFYVHEELGYFQKLHTVSGFCSEIALIKPLRAFLFFSGVALLPLLVMLRRALCDRRIRFFVLSGIVWIPGILLELFFIPHYLAPFTAALYVVGLQAMRHLYFCRPEGQPVGRCLVRLGLPLCLLLTAIRLEAEPLNLKLTTWPGGGWAGAWYGSEPFGETRARVQAGLESLPGKQLVIVRYSPDHSSLDEWVYNDADVDGEKVVWAREMGPTDDAELLNYYKDRKVWLVQPDTKPVQIEEYRRLR